MPQTCPWHGFTFPDHGKCLICLNAAAAATPGGVMPRTAFGEYPAMWPGASSVAARPTRGVEKKDAAAAMVAADEPDRLAEVLWRIDRERGYSSGYWVGRGHPINKDERNTAPYRATVQAIGVAYGCHECGKKIATDPDQPWVSDHVPPTNLTPASLATLGYVGAGPVARRLYPSCHDCSHLQSDLVNKFNAGTKTVATLSAAEVRMLRNNAGMLGTHYINATAATPTDTERAQIQPIGLARGCHICYTRYAATTYHADHYPPLELQGPSAVKLLELFGRASTRFELRPHCPKCSATQGGRNGKLATMLAELARELGYRA